jgi:hypothetical protein
MPAVPGPGYLRVDLGLEILMMLVGVDPHKQTHTAVAADELGPQEGAAHSAGAAGMGTGS